MDKHGIKPNVITYSTMLKGHCQMGDIQTGFQILDQMKKEGRARPDEIMYNSLLDGCALNSLVDEGLKLLEEMQREGVKPSNFTLSILVKMMNRARKLDSAFTLVEEIAQKYRFRPNVHVYTNLIQACVSNRSLRRGLQTLDMMARDWVAPDARTYNVLVRGCLQAGALDEAAGLLRASCGLPDPLPALAGVRGAKCNVLDGLVSE